MKKCEQAVSDHKIYITKYKECADWLASAQTRYQTCRDASVSATQRDLSDCSAKLSTMVSELATCESTASSSLMQHVSSFVVNYLTFI